MPPERVQGQRGFGAHTDVYGLGVTLYYLLTGRSPVSLGSPEEVVTRLRERPALTWSEEDLARVPKGIRVACERAAAPRAADRFASVEAFAEALQEAFDTREAIPPPLPTRARRQNRVAQGLLLLGLLSLVVAVIIGIASPKRAELPPTPQTTKGFGGMSADPGAR